MILTYFYCVIVALIVESLIALTHDIPYKGVKDLLKTTNKSVYIPLINIIFIFVGLMENSTVDDRCNAS